MYPSLTLKPPCLYQASWRRGGCFDYYRGLDILITDGMALYDDRVSIKIIGLPDPETRDDLALLTDLKR